MPPADGYITERGASLQHERVDREISLDDYYTEKTRNGISSVFSSHSFHISFFVIFIVIFVTNIGNTVIVNCYKYLQQ